MAQHYKYNTGATINNTTQKGNIAIATSGTYDWGPTSTTGFYPETSPPTGGYTIYYMRSTGGPSIEVATSDAQCVTFLKSFGATGSTIANVLSWASGQSNYYIQTGSTAPLTLGQSTLGGTVGYILQSGDTGYDASVQHGYIVWTADVTGSTFGGYGTIGAADYANWPSNNALGQGSANTTILINTNNATGTIGATIVTFNSGNPGGYNDWFVPSTGEYTAIDGKRLNSGISNWANDWYWCSEGMDQNVGRRYYMPGGGGNYDYRFLAHPYRPIRSF
jgi:hypothetical protein